MHTGVTYGVYTLPQVSQALKEVYSTSNGLMTGLQSIICLLVAYSNTFISTIL